jgi:transposase
MRSIDRDQLSRVKRPDHLPDDHHCPWREWAEELEERVETLETRVATLERHIFGRKSEKLPPVKQQLRVGDERNSPTALERRRQNAAARAELPEKLIHHRVPEEQRRCPKCGGSTLRSIGDGKTSVVSTNTCLRESSARSTCARR